jgi:hypothetical protein
VYETDDQEGQGNECWKSSVEYARGFCNVTMQYGLDMIPRCPKIVIGGMLNVFELDHRK